MPAGKFVDLTGVKFNNWVVLRKDSYKKKGKRSIYWLCECQCDKKTLKLFDSYSINNQLSKSCGCIKRKASNFIDLSGQVFHRLKVLHRVESSNRSKVQYLCECSCENKTKIIVVGSHLKNGNTKSCGCIGKEKLVKRNYKHGLSHSRIYNIWLELFRRCYNSKRKSYVNYGGRGIIVCDEWHDLDNFLNWSIENGYEENLSIDRIDVNGNYEPSNCRWATDLEQANNKRNNTFITIKGVKKTVSEWGRFYNVIPQEISRWNRKGILEKKLFELENGTLKRFKKVYITFKGITKLQADWGRIFDKHPSTISKWLKRGVLEEELNRLMKEKNMNYSDLKK